MKPIYELLEKSFSPFKGKAHDDLLFSSDYVGVEIEAEQVSGNRPRHTTFWDIASDDSLRNNGREFRFNQPLAGADIIGALNEIEKWFKDDGLSCVFNDRCSLHIHVDIRDLTVEQLQTMLLNWLFFEPLLFSTYINPSRRSNNFCVPLFHNVNKIKYLGSAFNSPNRPIHNLRGVVEQQFSKYDSLNLQAIYNFGSLEFRVFTGTHDKQEILRNINLCLVFKHLAKHNMLPKFVSSANIVKLFEVYKQQAFGDFLKKYPEVRFPTNSSIAKQGYLNVNLMFLPPSQQTPKSQTIGTLQKKLSSKLNLNHTRINESLKTYESQLQANEELMETLRQQAQPRRPQRVARRRFSVDAFDAMRWTVPTPRSGDEG